MKLQPGEVKKILLFRALQLGDLLCSVPALRALRAAYPHAEITLAGLPWAESLVWRFPDYLDRFIHFPGYPGLPEQPFDPAAITTFLNYVQQKQFDLALQMQGNGSVVNPMVELFDAKYTAGFRLAGHYYPDNGLFIDYPDSGHETMRHLKLMDHLGIPSQGTHLEFPLTNADQQEFDQLDLQLNPKQYVCVHPGSRGAWRQWPTNYFAVLADYCSEQGFAPVLTGTKEELPIVHEVLLQMKHQPVVTAGRTSIGAAGVLIKNAFALISNCTGVAHMASAFETPAVIISMDGEPERWAPMDKTLHHVIDWTTNPDFEAVFDAAKSLLSSRVKISSSL